MTLLKKRMIWMLVIVTVLVGGLLAYQAFMARMMMQNLSANTRPPATVTAMPAAFMDWQSKLHAVGTLRAAQGVNISAEVGGQVARVHVHSGQTVTRGALLVELNHADDTALLHALQADATLAGLSYKRDKAQLTVKAISRAQFDSSSAAWKRAQAVIEQQQALIAKKRITAPFAGQIGIVTLNPGQYLNPADVITTLQNSRSLYIDFHLPQKNISMLATGQRIRIKSDAWPKQRFDGEITAINSSVESATRNVRIEGRIDNAQGLLHPGMFTSVAVEYGKPARYLTVPQTSVSYNAYGATLFIARAPTAKQAGTATPKTASGSSAAVPLEAQQEFVKLGPTRGDQVAIVSGLNEGDMVVTSGQMKLKNDTPLIIDNRIQPTNDQAPTPQEQ